MRRSVVAIGASICILAAEPVAIAAAVSLAVFQLVLLMGRGDRREGSDEKVYTVYRYDFNLHAREAVGQVRERRRRERGNNYLDLLAYARKTYSAPSPGALIFLSID